MPLKLPFSVQVYVYVDECINLYNIMININEKNKLRPKESFMLKKKSFASFNFFFYFQCLIYSCKRCISKFRTDKERYAKLLAIIWSSKNKGENGTRSTCACK